MQSGWPKTRKGVSKDVQVYFDRRHELTIHNGCILRGLRVVIPQSLRERALREIHVSHAGVVRMKSIARLHVWWPSLDKEIENCAKQCVSCQENHKNPPKAQLHPWETATHPWDRLHLDFAGPYQGYMWLIVVDACSKWPEVISMTSTTAERTIGVLRQLFARFGLPNHIVTDNGPQFAADEFRQFCSNNDIFHTFVAPYHPSSNGQAERFVQTFKSAMQKGKGSELEKTLNQFLLRYRTTPHPKTGKTPSEIMFGRNIKTRLDLLHPKKAIQKEPSENRPTPVNCELKVNDLVWVRNYRGAPRWLPGEITIRLGPLNYKVRVRKQVWKRHLDQLRLREAKGTSRNTNANDNVNDFTDFRFDSPQNISLPYNNSDPPARRYPLRSNWQPPNIVKI